MPGTRGGALPCPGLDLRRARSFAWFRWPPALAEAHGFRQPRTRGGVVWRDHRIGLRQAPLRTISLGREAVLCPQVPLERLELEFVFQTGQVIGEASLKEVTALVSSLTDKVQTLFAEVGAETEEAFYKAHDQHRESVSLEGQLRDLDAQFAAHDSLELPQGLTEELLATQMAELEKSLSILEVELNTLIQEKAALVNKTEKLLSDGAYARKLQLFEMKKAELAELAKKWSERKAITEAIRRTMRELKEKKLPEVLEVAEKLFCELTGGNYESLSVTETRLFRSTIDKWNALSDCGAEPGDKRTGLYFTAIGTCGICQ